MDTYLFLERDFKKLKATIQALTEEVAALPVECASHGRYAYATNRLRYLSEVLSRAICIDLVPLDSVTLGSRVVCHYHRGQGTEKNREYHRMPGESIYEIGSYLVFDDEPVTKISYDSIIGRVLMGATPGHSRVIDLPYPTDYKLEIVRIE